MIGITNIGGDNFGVSRYKVWVTDADGVPQEICRFEHNRMDGLGLCLLEASKAVERGKWEETHRLMELIHKEERDGSSQTDSKDG